MRLEGKEMITGICSICGDHIGKGFDHKECSELKNEMHKSDVRKARTKKLKGKELNDYVKRLGSIQ